MNYAWRSLGAYVGCAPSCCAFQRPNGVLSIYLAMEAAAHEPDLDYITTFISCFSETKMPEQSVAFLRQCGADLAGASAKNMVEVMVPPDDGGSSGDRTRGANSNKSAEVKGGESGARTLRTLPKAGKIFSRLEVHPPASLEFLSVSKGEPMHVTDAMIDSVLELNGCSQLNDMKQRHRKGVFGVVRRTTIANTGDGMLPWEPVCPEGLLRKQWKALRVTDHVVERSLLPPNHPTKTKVTELKPREIVIACHLFKCWADLVSVHITENANSLATTVKNTAPQKKKKRSLGVVLKAGDGGNPKNQSTPFPPRPPSPLSPTRPPPPPSKPRTPPNALVRILHRPRPPPPVLTPDAGVLGAALENSRGAAGRRTLSSRILPLQVADAVINSLNLKRILDEWTPCHPLMVPVAVAVRNFDAEEWEGVLEGAKEPPLPSVGGRYRGVPQTAACQRCHPRLVPIQQLRHLQLAAQDGGVRVQRH